MENQPETEHGSIIACFKLLNQRDFAAVKFIVEMSKLVRYEKIELDQAEAICDVLIAAENPLPNGSMDYYGMLRVTRLEPVVLDDFKTLMKLLDGRHNRFPFSQEAAQHALQAWSILSKPHIKAEYDFALTQYERRDRSNGRRWLPSEDLKLREHVEAFGPQNWKKIAEQMQGRTDKTCRSRWVKYLDPRINRGPFSDEEEQKLLEAQRELGNQWYLIARRFIGRTDNDVKVHWHRLMKRNSKEQ